MKPQKYYNNIFIPHKVQNSLLFLSSQESKQRISFLMMKLILENQLIHTETFTIGAMTNILEMDSTNVE